MAEFLKCCEACRHFGKNWSCPPYDFNPEDYWSQYEYIYVFGAKIIFDSTITNSEIGKLKAELYLMREFHKTKKVLTEKMIKLEKRYPGSISLSAGNCSICQSCTRLIEKNCVYPDKLRYSIESLGGNVVKTADELLGLELIWSNRELPEYLVLVSGFLSDDPNVIL